MTVQAGSPPLLCVLALLNARLLSWLFRQLFSALSLSGGYLRVGSAQIGTLPLPRLENVTTIQLADGADRLLAAAPAQWEQADRALDQLVYELYGLSAEEIAQVEESFDSGPADRARCREGAIVRAR